MENLLKVNGVTETVRIDPQGEAVKIHKVTATARSGDRFTMEIPDADFDLAKVEVALKGKAEELEAIRKLTG